MVLSWQHTEFVDPVLRWHPGSDLFVFRVHNDLSRPQVKFMCAPPALAKIRVWTLLQGKHIGMLLHQSDRLYVIPGAWPACKSVGAMAYTGSSFPSESLGLQGMCVKNLVLPSLPSSAQTTQW